VLPPTDPFDPFRQLKVQSGRPHRCSPARVRPVPSARAVSGSELHVPRRGCMAPLSVWCMRRCVLQATIVVYLLHKRLGAALFTKSDL
jgi:hypothetical protein